MSIAEDIDESTFANCHGPLSVLLWAFGIQTLRNKFTRDAWNRLPEKKCSIVGKANMSYAPHFMPDYQAAFAYSGAAALRAAQRRQRASTASGGYAASSTSTSSGGIRDVPTASADGGFI